MIRTERGAEPPGLAEIRTNGVAALRRKVANGEEITRADLAGYGVAREVLWQSQHRKCAYCEDSMKFKFEPVEHYRPARRAIRGTEFPDYGYWWLAWTWSNLLFACSICNSSHKRDHFPLEPGSIPLQDPEEPPGLERTVLIDPSRPDDPDPMDLIVFQPVGSRRWIPTGRDGNARGALIVAVLGLDAPAHLTRYAAHVEEYLTPHVEALAAALRAGDDALIEQEWNQAVRHVRRPRPWAALSYDVLDFHFPETVRNEHGLVLSRP
jgi:hypothetical protein